MNMQKRENEGLSFLIEKKNVHFILKNMSFVVIFSAVWILWYNVYRTKQSRIPREE